MCQFINYMEIEYLNVYNPSFDEQKDSNMYAENVRIEVSNYLGIPMTSHTYEDMLLMQTAILSHEPASVVDITVERIKDLLQIDVKSAKELMKRFAAIDSKWRWTS